MKLTEKQKRKIVDTIINSNTFKKAPTSIALLLYLFEATKKEIPLKESVIDIEFFKSKNATDRTNPRVRVNAYNLRKKISQFYATEGKHDVWRLKIEKGQYQVSFYKKPQEYSLIKTAKWKTVIPYTLLFISLGTLLVMSLPKVKPILWESFLSNAATTHLYLGDHFGLTGKTITNNQGWTRDFSINDADEFYEFIDKHLDLRTNLKPSHYSYITRMGALASQKFQKFFQHHEKEFSVRFSTQTSFSEIKEGNAIYVGPTKNNNQFLHFYNQANPFFEISSDALKHKTNQNQYNLNTGNETQEYAIVSKYPVDKTTHFLFFSQHDIGVIATIEYFTNKDSIAKFTQSHLKDKKYFTAIFMVKGQDRTNTSLKLEQVFPF
ncbi:hypothetical protein KFZ70_14330 [Tamlana fucoidanivorans]|uniref:Uncharacterized protein n=1 Tax=Allotamlana fucoidanivorans TaxID=2583814 RepID=A0A5C4SQR2_9FLAO|nr:hypothetical protein [Tamlana fucoidanivorans]TNJ46605.1 hypothetical protein FGF67_02940 [Tamlana fucoidanivorans]